jgi:hypothetical protein
LQDRIIDAALALAEADAGGGWYDFRLHLVAQRLGVPLEATLLAKSVNGLGADQS